MVKTFHLKLRERHTFLHLLKLLKTSDGKSWTKMKILSQKMWMNSEKNLLRVSKTTPTEK